MRIKRIFSGLFSNEYTDDRGYKRFTDSDKLVHRWAVEKKIGRKLRDEEVVHHKNRDKKDNSPDNLYPCSPKVHNRIHKSDAKKHGKKASYQGFKKKKSIWDILN